MSRPRTRQSAVSSVGPVGPLPSAQQNGVGSLSADRRDVCNNSSNQLLSASGGATSSENSRGKSSETDKPCGASAADEGDSAPTKLGPPKRVVKRSTSGSPKAKNEDSRVPNTSNVYGVVGGRRLCSLVPDPPDMKGSEGVTPVAPHRPSVDDKKSKGLRSSRPHSMVSTNDSSHERPVNSTSKINPINSDFVPLVERNRSCLSSDSSSVQDVSNAVIGGLVTSELPLAVSDTTEITHRLLSDQSESSLHVNNLVSNNDPVTCLSLLGQTLTSNLLMTANQSAVSTNGSSNEVSSSTSIILSQSITSRNPVQSLHSNTTVSDPMGTSAPPVATSVPPVGTSVPSVDTSISLSNCHVEDASSKPVKEVVKNVEPPITKIHTTSTGRKITITKSERGG